MRIIKCLRGGWNEASGVFPEFNLGSNGAFISSDRVTVYNTYKIGRSGTPSGKVLMRADLEDVEYYAEISITEQDGRDLQGQAYELGSLFESVESIENSIVDVFNAEFMEILYKLEPGQVTGPDLNVNKYGMNNQEALANISVLIQALEHGEQGDDITHRLSVAKESLALLEEKGGAGK